MKDINYALMLIKANKLDGAKDLLEELLKSDPRTSNVLSNLFQKNYKHASVLT